MKHQYWLIFILMTLILQPLKAQEAGKFTAIARQDYYTTEQQAQIILNVPDEYKESNVMIDLVYGKDQILFHAKIRSDRPVLVPVNIHNFPKGENIITTSFYVDNKWLISKKVNINILPHQRNAVKTDRFQGTLISDGLPFFPSGFYTYSPIQQGLAESEKAKGFNMISPYNLLKKYSLDERKAFMDRMADIGMKVNYNLLSLSGGGGVNHKDGQALTEIEKRALLIKEIEAFKNHPALLSWYICDEPVGQGVSAEFLKKQYQLIKSIDPYHPISIVFMAPQSAAPYADAMDIVMTDPYPIPANDPIQVATTVKKLYETFRFEKAVWLVPQAFGGNEYWKREPTPNEMRLMTWYGIMNGATGLQYFIRSAYQAFPKSTQSWNACSQSVTEINALLPYLLSNDIHPNAECLPKTIQTQVWKWGNKLLFVCANSQNEPTDFKMKIEGLHYSGPLKVIDQQRTLMMQKGEFKDLIGAYGVQIYTLELEALNPEGAQKESSDINGSFENNSQPGIPESCYVIAGSDLGSNYAIDTRRASEGSQSLRLTTATEGKGNRISMYPISLEKGRSYTISMDVCMDSLWKPVPEKRNFWQRLFRSKPDNKMYFLMGTDKYNLQEKALKNGWNTYSVSTFIPEKSSSARKNILFELMSKGSVWVDNIRVKPGISISSKEKDGKLLLYIDGIQEDERVLYTFDGSRADIDVMSYEGAIEIPKSCTIKAVSFLGDSITGTAERSVKTHQGLGNTIKYLTPFSKKYSGGGKKALTDGRTAGTGFRDDAWQGFIGKQLTLIMDLKEGQKPNEIKLSFLQSQLSWIFLPERIEIYGTTGEGADELLWDSGNIITEQNGRKLRKSWVAPISNSKAYEQLKFKIHTIDKCPEWHPGSGKAAWLFLDEIEVN